MRVLHIEDNPADLDLTRRWLEQTAPDIQLEQVPTRAAAVERLSNGSYWDLALIDLRLPDGSGMDLLAWIRERKQDIAVVMITGSGDQDAAITALRTGADDYLVKGVTTLDRLPTTLRDARQRFDAAHASRSGPIRVLYAEHSSIDTDLTLRHLARFAPHIRLTQVANAEEALARLPLDPDTEPDFDALLLDYHPPGLDALDTLKILRAERHLDIPVVLVTGQGSEDVAARAIHLGANDYLSKHPGYLHKLPATLEKVLNEVRLVRERANLRAAAHRLDMALAASPIVLYTRQLNRPGMPLTWVSDNVQRFGYEAEQLLDQDWWATHLHPDDRDSAHAALETLLETGSLALDYRLLDSQGRIRWIHDELRLPDPGERQSGEATGAWSDVTESKQTELLRNTRLTVLNALIEDQPLIDILDVIATQLEQLYRDTRVSIRVLEDGLLSLSQGDGTEHTRFAVEPDHDDSALVELDTSDGAAGYPSGAPVPGWSIPFQDAHGTSIGNFSVRYAEPRAPAPSECNLILEFGCLARLAVTRITAESKLRQAATVFESTREGVIITDLDSHIIAVNPAYTDITGYTAEEVRGQTPRILRSGRQDDAFYQTLWANITSGGHWQGEVWNRRKSGEIYPQLLSISAVYDPQGTPTHYVGVMTDISQIKRSEERLEHLVHFDPLTNLPNRRLVLSRLHHAIEQTERSRRRVAVLFLDLDRFKNVNDSLGHPVGDELLQALTQRLRERLREEDTLGRLGGDEFLVLLENLERTEDAGRVARALLQLLQEPFELPSGPVLYIGASIGISIFPDDGNSVTELVKHADVAMYQAKEQGRNTYRFYTSTLTIAANERLELDARLRRALINEEFILHYQPQFDSLTGMLIGCEALVRWHSPEHGLIAPDRFIPLAEETGLIVQLGDWVLQTACAQHKLWLDNGLPDIMIAVNLSARQLQQQDFAERVAAILDATGLPAERLTLELTESMIMLPGEQAIELLRELKALGLKLSIDDFGTGYSSLAYLKRLPIDELKIDQGFVRDIPQDRNDMEIAATIIAMARNLNLKVIAEGVETDQQMEFLTLQGCHGYQGYLLGHPLTPEAFIEQLLHAPNRLRPGIARL
ncbi:response regulator receiver modulated diguanylate cyclase/phosphodiesterase with PAS/PAC sensor(s) [Thiorhodococcus drewsii AZ1]|uniref:cyclic-guanylate-specific phosphodiesterase n=1 Tax=Thiorhodococcus drewsii AZ1 TaxID=765913 RepID=G2E434_9GAMM|nr:EAL domain-containing protein [Thiorhodococcus drewsii]EGV29927.1 response regulator receiver modulated diguanylate cyclase/phosphodiesterase with PAS/PAC sensor(s) [Thiorhodococcus drewsii AZ1]